MENYALAALIVLVLGMTTIAVMLERRRRTEQAHFEKLRLTLDGCLETLQAIHSDGVDGSAKVAQSMNELRLGSEAQSQELLAETQRTTKAVVALKTSLEESVKFDKP